MTGLLERLASVTLPESSVTIEGIPGGAVEFRLRAMGHRRSAVLVVSNPPRPGNEVDGALGYNPETYYPAIIRECCYALVSGDETVELPDDAVDDAWWSRLFENLNSAQFNKLFGAAWVLDGEDAVPSSAPASQTSPVAGGSSQQPELGASARSGSTAGNRKRSRSTSTTKPAA